MLLMALCSFPMKKGTTKKMFRALVVSPILSSSAGAAHLHQHRQ